MVLPWLFLGLYRYTIHKTIQKLPKNRWTQGMSFWSSSWTHFSCGRGPLVEGAPSAQIADGIRFMGRTMRILLMVVLLTMKNIDLTTEQWILLPQFVGYIGLWLNIPIYCYMVDSYKPTYKWGETTLEVSHSYRWNTCSGLIFCR